MGSMRHLEITTEELKSLFDRGEAPALIDVREPREHAICALPGSRLIPLRELPRRLDEVDAEREVILYCHHGVRSLQAAYFLTQNGFAARSLAGGIDAWAWRVDPAMPRY
jgi:rhodanese-related sulfurtransferase